MARKFIKDRTTIVAHVISSSASEALLRRFFSIAYGPMALFHYVMLLQVCAQQLFVYITDIREEQMSELLFPAITWCTKLQESRQESFA